MEIWSHVELKFPGIYSSWISYLFLQPEDDRDLIQNTGLLGEVSELKVCMSLMDIMSSVRGT